MWALVVCLGFIGAGILIGKSYKEWQEKPIATSITTHPIDDLDFPNVTICPPKDSNTALYHDLVKAGNGLLSDENRKTFRKAAHVIFMEQIHKEYVKRMSATSHMGNLDQVLQGFHSLPKHYNNANGLKIKMRNLRGKITTPWFEKGYVEEFFLWDRDILMVLELPDSIKDQVGGGSLIINLEVNTREEVGWMEEVSTFTLHTTEKNWSEAESDCQNEGGHLASVTTEEVNQVVKHIAGNNNGVWLGGRGRKEEGELTWSDKSIWGYTNWQERQSDGDCVRSSYGEWQARSCSTEYQFVCNNILKGGKTLSLTFTKGSCHLRFSGIRPLRGGGVPPFSAKEKNLLFFTLIFR